MNSTVKVSNDSIIRMMNLLTDCRTYSTLESIDDDGRIRRDLDVLQDDLVSAYVPPIIDHKVNTLYLSHDD